MLLETFPAEFLLLGAALLGLLVGSFLNVVIYRLPVMMRREWEEECRMLMAETQGATLEAANDDETFNLSVPRSRCGNCGTQITALQNIPVFSWLFLKGKCASCGTKISVRYPIIEAVTSVITVLIVWQFGFNLHAVAAMYFCWSLIALTMIDADHQLLPDSMTLPLVWAGILISLFEPHHPLLAPDLQSSVIGAIAGYLALWTVYQVFKKLTGKEGMGYGDFKLLAALGAWLGWQAIPQLILLSAVVGSVVGISLILFTKHERQTPIPFGPYLAGAGLLSILWGPELSGFMSGLFG